MSSEDLATSWWWKVGTLHCTPRWSLPGGSWTRVDLVWWNGFWMVLVCHGFHSKKRGTSNHFKRISSGMHWTIWEASWNFQSVFHEHAVRLTIALIWKIDTLSVRVWTSNKLYNTENIMKMASCIQGSWSYCQLWTSLFAARVPAADPAPAMTRVDWPHVSPHSFQSANFNQRIVDTRPFCKSKCQCNYQYYCTINNWTKKYLQSSIYTNMCRHYYVMYTYMPSIDN